MKALLLGAIAAASIAGCSDKDNGCAQAMDYLNKAQAAYDAAVDANLSPEMVAQAKQLLELAWIGVPQFCAARPEVSPAN
jgi:hypothetical protein